MPLMSALDASFVPFLTCAWSGRFLLTYAYQVLQWEYCKEINKKPSSQVITSYFLAIIDELEVLVQIRREEGQKDVNPK